MSETRAWLRQARSDHQAAQVLMDSRREEMKCQVVAKCQQAVEKSVKALVGALNDSRVMRRPIGYKHNVERFMAALIHLPRREDLKDMQRQIYGLLSEQVRADIRALENLTPKAPPPGENPSRNTEYPFIDATGSWKAPADKAVFSNREIERFRALADRLYHGCSEIVSALNLLSQRGAGNR